MKNYVKRFGQAVNEQADRFGMRSETPKSVADLVDYYIKSAHPSGFVLVCLDVSNPARDLMHGGLEIMIEPSKEEIAEMVDTGYYACELYENGEKVDSMY